MGQLYTRQSDRPHFCQQAVSVLSVGWQIHPPVGLELNRFHFHAVYAWQHGPAAGVSGQLYFEYPLTSPSFPPSCPLPSPFLFTKDTL